MLDALLPSVINFLRYFPQFLDVIVRCARKIEVTLWEYLFSIVGDPKDLFSYCLDTNNLHTATSYLIVIQTLEPSSISSRLQAELLQRTLESENFELCSEIVRYLAAVNAKGQEIVQTFSETASGSQSSLQALSPEDEQNVRRSLT